MCCNCCVQGLHNNNNNSALHRGRALQERQWEVKDKFGSLTKQTREIQSVEVDFQVNTLTSDFILFSAFPARGPAGYHISPPPPSPPQGHEILHFEVISSKCVRLRFHSKQGTPQSSWTETSPAF